MVTEETPTGQNPPESDNSSVTDLDKLPELTDDELTELHRYMEDTLVRLRDARISEFTARNGLVIKEYDGTHSRIIRIGTRYACRMIVEKFLQMRGLA